MQFLYLFFLLIWTCSLFSYESSPNGNNNSRSIPSVEVKFDQPVKQSSHNWNVSGNVSVITNSSYRNAAHYTVLTHASPRLQHYFTHVVNPLMHDATVHNHCCILPGYTFAAGFRDCINQLAQFSSSDPLLTVSLAQRLETYCTRIENIVFRGKNHSFCETLSHQDQVALLNVYADFLKEFYAQNAPFLFFEQSTHNSMMQGVMRHIDWQSYDGKNIKSTPKQLQQHHAASVNGNLGAVYKAFHEGNSAQAYAIGNERVKTLIPRLLIGEKVKVTSVFEQYPALRQKIEPVYLAAQAKIEQQRLTQQTRVQQGAAAIKAQFKEGINVKTLFSDRTQQRYNSAVYHVDNPAFFKKMHAVAAEQAARIKPCHLTPDQKGILFEGGHLQHTLLDETISVIDTAISGDLVDTMQNVVIDLANTSIESNKHGQIVVTTQALDTCWAIIEYAHNAAKCAYTGVLNNMHPIERGIYHGAVDSISGVVHAVLHPIETAKETAQSLATLGYCLGKLAYASCVYDAACDVLESNPKRYEEMIAQYSIHPDALRAIYEHAKNASLEDVARVGTKTIIDTMLLRDVTNIVAVVAKEHWVSLIGCMRKGERSAEVALTAENIPIKCGEEIASIVQKMENTVHKTGRAAEIISDSRAFIESRTHDLLNKIKNEIEIFKTKFGRCTQFKNQWLQFDYEHMFTLNDIYWKKGKPSNLGGFHHDFMGSMRDSGAIQVVEKFINKSGYYLADIKIDDVLFKGKTFFPQHWTREKVTTTIYEAYNKFIQSGAEAILEVNGKYKIEVLLEEGVKLRMIITENGLIRSAYPILEAKGL